MTRYITTAQAAQILQVSVRRVRALIETGKLDAYKAGRDWLIVEADVYARKNNDT